MIFSASLVELLLSDKQKEVTVNETLVSLESGSDWIYYDVFSEAYH